MSSGAFAITFALGLLVGWYFTVMYFKRPR